jgi:hypothetical protein
MERSLSVREEGWFTTGVSSFGHERRSQIIEYSVVLRERTVSA